MAVIPPFVVEYFMLGRTRGDAIERYTQDGGIVTDVWLAFAADRRRPQRVLVAPCPGVSTVEVAAALHAGIADYRASSKADGERVKPGISPLENFIALTIYFDELLRVVLPMTAWWRRKNLDALRQMASPAPNQFAEMLRKAILVRLGRDQYRRDSDEPTEDEATLRRSARAAGQDARADRSIVDAAPLAALIGVFLAADDPEFLKDIDKIHPQKVGIDPFTKWVAGSADIISRRAQEEFAIQYKYNKWLLRRRNEERGTDGADEHDAPELIQRVFLDRPVGFSSNDALCTIKADAANRVFDVSCRAITWAVIDAGIATTHPAFLDQDARDRRGVPLAKDKRPSRVRATFDFTLIDRIRNFDLIEDPAGSAGRAAAIDAVVAELSTLPGRDREPDFAATARDRLTEIARQLDKRLPPDWNLIEPLIRLAGDDGATLVSDHGTHVAGILGADWRAPKPGTTEPEVSLLTGVCPDINLYDLRVIHPDDNKRTEFAVLAALEFVRFVNDRAGANGPVLHGVNLSLSIPHDVRNYGCGATPVCVACDRVAQSGVVVVAAAGNRGWNEQEIGFGNFVFCSITDPGNAREAITVGSTHRARPHEYGVSYFSSRGPPAMDGPSPTWSRPANRFADRCAAMRTTSSTAPAWRRRS